MQAYNLIEGLNGSLLIWLTVVKQCFVSVWFSLNDF